MLLLLSLWLFQVEESIFEFGYSLRAVSKLNKIDRTQQSGEGEKEKGTRIQKCKIEMRKSPARLIYLIQFNPQKFSLLSCQTSSVCINIHRSVYICAGIIVFRTMRGLEAFTRDS